MHHLHRVASEYESNNMTASNLAIVFGPTLLRRNEDTTSMTQVLETIHQARAVELLTIYVEVKKIFNLPVEKFKSGIKCRLTIQFLHDAKYHSKSCRRYLALVITCFPRTTINIQPTGIQIHHLIPCHSMGREHPVLPNLIITTVPVGIT